MVFEALYESSTLSTSIFSSFLCNKTINYDQICCLTKTGKVLKKTSQSCFLSKYSKWWDALESQQKNKKASVQIE